MKRVLFTITAIAAFFFAACESDSFDTVFTPEGELVNIEIVADADADTRVSVDGKTATWESGDKITVAFIGDKTSYATFEIKSSSDITNNGKSAKFFGTVAKGTYSAITALYPAVTVSDDSSSVVISLDNEDNVYMSAQTPGSSITINDNSSLSLDFKHLMHKVDVNLSLASGYTSTDLEAAKVDVEFSVKSGTTNARFMTNAYFMWKENIISQQTDTDKIKIEMAGKSGATSLSGTTMLFPHAEISNAVFQYDVYIDGEKRYQIINDTKNSVTMTKGKRTTLDIVLSEEALLGNEDPVLTVSKTSIIANGEDSVVFTVMQGELDTTDKATFYVNEGKILSNIYSTTTAGEYSVYAKVGKKISNTVTFKANEPGVGTSTVFARGVTATSGWYDVNKKGRGDNGDSNMCWAAASSNILQWWQDQYKAAGNTLPEGCPDGVGKKSYADFGPYELEIMEVFHSDWDNMAGGGWIERGVAWYLEGVDVRPTMSNGAKIIDPNSGGYFKSNWDDIESKMYSGYEFSYTEGINNSKWRYKEGTWEAADISVIASRFTEYIVKGFEYGMLGMAIVQNPNFGGAGHSVTLWGYELDNTTNLVSKLYLTDSDDLANTLQVYTVTYDESIMAKIKLSRAGAADWYPQDLVPVAAYNSAPAN